MMDRIFALLHHVKTLGLSVPGEILLHLLVLLLRGVVNGRLLLVLLLQLLLVVLVAVVRLLPWIRPRWDVLDVQQFIVFMGSYVSVVGIMALVVVLLQHLLQHRQIPMVNRTQFTVRLEAHIDLNGVTCDGRWGGEEKKSVSLQAGPNHHLDTDLRNRNVILRESIQRTFRL